MLTRPTQAHKLTLHETIGTFPHHFSLLPWERQPWHFRINFSLIYTRSSFSLLSPFLSIWGQSSMSGLSELPSKRLTVLNQAADLKYIRIIFSAGFASFQTLESTSPHLLVPLSPRAYCMATIGQQVSATLGQPALSITTKAIPRVPEAHSHWVPVKRTRNAFPL